MTSHKILNILLVEDSPVDSYMIRKVLSKSMPECQVDHVSDMKHAKGYLLDINNNIDLILLDLGLPDTYDADDTFHSIYTEELDIPIIILTSEQDHDLSISLIGEGAEDYVKKSQIVLYPERICDAIDFALCRHKNINTFKHKTEDAIVEKNLMIEWMNGGYSVR